MKERFIPPVRLPSKQPVAPGSFRTLVMNGTVLREQFKAGAWVVISTRPATDQDKPGIYF